MARWAHADTLDGSLNVIKTNCNKLAVVAAYSAGDSYATVTGGSNILAEVTMASGDFTLGTSGSDRTLTTASGKQDASANNSGTSNTFVFLDTVNSKVLGATVESSAQSVTAGNPVNFPQIVLTSKQWSAPA